MKKEETNFRNPDIITFGSAVIDHYAMADEVEINRNAQRPTSANVCFPLGEKLNLDELILQTGGGATNAATTFAHLGYKTAVVCRVGKDLFGEYICSELEKSRISTQFVQTDSKLTTAQSIIFLSKNGQRTIFVHRGASAAIDKRSIPWKSLSAKWFYVTSLGGDLGLMKMILDRAEAIGASVFWNPGRRELKKGLHLLKPLIQRVDLFDVNREEAAFLSEKPPRHLKSIIDEIGGLPRIGLIITDGPKGAYLHTKCCTWHIPPLPGKNVNATGAGDALGSGFVSGFLKTCDLSVGMKIGALNATGVIMNMGAKMGILKTWPTDAVLNRIRIKSVHPHD